MSCNWNHNGSILAIAGSTILSGQTNECNIVKFYSPFGEVGSLINYYHCIKKKKCSIVLTFLFILPSAT